MRSFALALVLCGLSLLAPGAVRADDDPPKPPAIAQQDECETLIDALLADAEPERLAAEAKLAQAGDAQLRKIVARLLRRLRDQQGPVIEMPVGHEPPPLAPEPAPDPEAVPIDENAPIISIQVRLLDATAEAAGQILASGKAGADGSTTFDAGPLAERLKALAASGGARLITSPQLTTLAGQRADISVLNQLSYVQDFEVESVSNVADPIIGTLQEGMVLQVRAKPTAEGLLVDTKLTLSDVVRPIQELKTRLASGGPEVTIQLPEMRVQRWERKVAVTGGVPVLLASMDSPEPGPGRRLIAILEARLLPNPNAPR